MNWTIEPPTQPGTYWFRRDAPSRDIMVQVRRPMGNSRSDGMTKINRW